MAIWEGGKISHSIGIKVCIYILSPEYGEYGMTRWASLPNVLGHNKIPYGNEAHPFIAVLLEQQKNSRCILNVVGLPYIYSCKYTTLGTCPEGKTTSTQKDAL